MKVLFTLLAIVVVTQANAGTINNIAGDISKVAVAGHEAIENIIHRIENGGDGAQPEPIPVEEIEELKHKHKHHHRDLEVEDINRNKFANGIDKINGIFVEPQPFFEEPEEQKHKHKHHKHHRRDFDGISVESAEFQFDEIPAEPQPFFEEAEEQKHKHKHHKHHRRDFDGISVESVEFQFEEAEEQKHKHKHHHRSLDGTSQFSNGINFNVNFQRPKPIVEDAEQQHKHRIGDFIDQIYNIQNEVNQIRDDIHDAINTAHELVNNVHNVFHPRDDAETKNLVSDGATIIPELANMGVEVIKALQNLVNNLAASQSLMANDVDADFL